jgi:ribonuclease P/MRP protein subunit RPP1
MNLIRVTRGRNLILSSQAQKFMELRGPFDAANLYLTLACLCDLHQCFSGFLFGLNQDQSTKAVRENVRRVLLHAGAPSPSINSFNVA